MGEISHHIYTIFSIQNKAVLSLLKFGSHSILMIFRNSGSGFSQLFNSEIRLNTSFYCEMIGRVSGPGRLTPAKTFQESFEYKKKLELRWTFGHNR